MRTILAITLFTAGCKTTMRSNGDAHDNAESAWNTRLSEIVSDDGYVDYAALESDRTALDDYVAWLASEPAWEGRLRKNRHALYLNAYNALVMFQVLERGRPDSVLDVDGWIPVRGSGFFVETQFPLGTPRRLGRPPTIGSIHRSLSEIEHEFIRQRFMDVRDHAALNCASRSCPPMRASLYEQDLLDEQLDEQMSRWITDPQRGVRVRGDDILFNPIFEWFERDFQFWTVDQTWCQVAMPFADAALRKVLRDAQAKGCDVSTFEYDWSLNDASKKQ